VRRLVDGQVVVVTGASRGIGREVARRLASVDATVVGVARDPDALDELATRCRGHFHGIAGDLRDLAWAEDASRRILAEYGAPALLVANAGQSIHRFLAEYEDRFHDVQRTAGVNYLGAVAFALPILAAMRARGSGQLIYISTTGVDVPTPGWSAYTASKAAHEAWLRSVAPELRTDGIATTSIHLPRVRTAMSAPTAGRYPVRELSVAQAADIVCRAIECRPRFVIPWWARLAAVPAGGAPGVVQRVWELVLRAGLRP